MDPVSLVVGALAAGAAAAAQETASTAIKDAYAGLKALVQRRFAGKPDAELVLAKYEQKPTSWQEPLKDELAATAVENDTELIKAAQQLMGLIDPQQAAVGKYNVQIRGNVQGFAQGDNQQVTMNFGDKKS